MDASWTCGHWITSTHMSWIKQKRGGPSTANTGPRHGSSAAHASIGDQHHHILRYAAHPAKDPEDWRFWNGAATAIATQYQVRPRPLGPLASSRDRSKQCKTQPRRSPVPSTLPCVERCRGCPALLLAIGCSTDNSAILRRRPDLSAADQPLTSFSVSARKPACSLCACVVC